MSKTICIAGKNQIAVDALEFVLNSRFSSDVIALTNKDDDGIDRWQPSFKQFAEVRKVETVQLSELYAIEDLVFFSLEFDRILKPHKFKSQELFNIHFSLLPAYKGVFTSIWPILNGEDRAGVTLHRIDHGIDTGEIVVQTEFHLPGDYTSRDLYFRFLEEARKLFANSWELVCDGEYRLRAQSSNQSSYYSRSSLDLSATSIDLNSTAHMISRHIRAFSFPEYQLPQLNGRNIVSHEISNNRSENKPGMIVAKSGDSLTAATIDYDIDLHFESQ